MTPDQNLPRDCSRRYTWLWILAGLAGLAGLLYWLCKRRGGHGMIQPVQIDLSFTRPTLVPPPQPVPVQPPAEVVSTPLPVEESTPGSLEPGPAAEPPSSPASLEEMQPSTSEIVPPTASGLEAVPAAAAADDLVALIGVGPKIAAVLRAAGVDTFASLSRSDPAELRKILDAAGLRLADPATWPEQAHLAAEGRWHEMRELVARKRANPGA